MANAGHNRHNTHDHNRPQPATQPHLHGAVQLLHRQVARGVHARVELAEGAQAVGIQLRVLRVLNEQVQVREAVQPALQLRAFGALDCQVYIHRLHDDGTAQQTATHLQQAQPAAPFVVPPELWPWRTHGCTAAATHASDGTVLQRSPWIASGCGPRPEPQCNHDNCG